VAEKSIQASRAAGFTWAEGIASTVAGILHAVTADPDSSRARHSDALEIQRRLGDCEGMGMFLGGLARLASGRGDTAAALELYRQSLAAFEAVGDRGEEARILSEMAWTHLAQRRPGACASDLLRFGRGAYRRGQRPRDRALAGRLAATEAAERRPQNALLIAAAAEVYAQQEGIAVIYTEDTPGREFVEQARAAIPADEVARVTEQGRRLTIREALDLARTAQKALA
jgi:hypothetical protein